jgi:hypothetical protein
MFAARPGTASRQTAEMRRYSPQLVIPLERHDETGQIVTGDCIDRVALKKDRAEAIEHSFIFAMRVGLFNAGSGYR